MQLYRMQVHNDYSHACSLVGGFVSPDVLCLQEHQSNILSNIQHERIFVKRAMEKGLSTTHHQENSATFVISGYYRNSEERKKVLSVSFVGAGKVAMVYEFSRAFGKTPGNRAEIFYIV
ncbi:hypothetical protein CBL_08564 [Carabus blaptoides fortunei]